MNIKKIRLIPRRIKIYIAGILTFLCAGYFDVSRVWEKFTELWLVKLVLAVISGAIFALFGEPTAIMRAVAYLVVIDFATKLWAISKEAGGFWVAWKTDAISSEGMRRAIPKTVWYTVLVSVSYQMAHFVFLGNIFGITLSPIELTCAYLALIEIKSILENLRDTGMRGLEPLIRILGEKQKQLTRKSIEHDKNKESVK